MRVTLHFMGRNGHKLGAKYRPLLCISRRLPHPRMEPRNECNVHVLGYRIAITWGAL